MAKAHFTFTLSYDTPDANPTLIISPSLLNAGYKPLELIIDPEQWDKIRYHFMTADRPGTSLPVKVGYVA